MQVEPSVDTEKVRGIPRFGQHPNKNWIGDKKITKYHDQKTCMHLFKHLKRCLKYQNQVDNTSMLLVLFVNNFFI